MYISSPLKYMGNKASLMPVIISRLPKNCTRALDMFGGSGVVSANLSMFYSRVDYCENNPNTYGVLDMFQRTTCKSISNRIKKYSDMFDLRPDNNDGFEEFKAYVNTRNDYFLFWMVARHAHSNLFRFSKKTGFNVAFGKRSLLYRLDDVMKEIREFKHGLKSVHLHHCSYAEYLNDTKLTPRTFVYVDPPYYASGANIYGSWTDEDEMKLLRNLIRLDNLGVPWMLSNVTQHRQFTNDYLISFLESHKFNVLKLDKTYCLANNVSDSYNTHEVLVTNF